MWLHMFWFVCLCFLTCIYVCALILGACLWGKWICFSVHSTLPEESVRNLMLWTTIQMLESNLSHLEENPVCLTPEPPHQQAMSPELPPNNPSKLKQVWSFIKETTRFTWIVTVWQVDTSGPEEHVATFKVFYIYLSYFKCIGVLSSCMCVHLLCVWCPRKSL